MGKLFGLFHRDHAGNETPVAGEVIDEQVDASTPTQGTLLHGLSPAESPVTAEMQKLRAELATERAARATEAAQREAEKKAEADRIKTIRVEGLREAGIAFAAQLKTDRKILPASEKHVANAHTYAALVKAGLSTEGFDIGESLLGLLSNLPAHNLTGETVATGKLPAGLFAMPNDRANEGNPDIWSADMETVRKQNDEYFARMGRQPSNGRN